MGALAAMMRKDLRLELRSGRSTIALVALSLLIMVVLVFALGASATRRVDSAAGALWVALIFSGMLGATRALNSESENGCIRGLLLSPLDPAAIFVAKLGASFIFMAIAEAAAVLLAILFFNLDVGAGIARLAGVMLLGALGFAALATLLAAISERTRAGDLMLPLLAVPMFVPALIAGVKASSLTLSGAPPGAISQWIRILAAFDVLFVTAGYLLFEHVVGEDQD
ncbi:MAG TPA: heme exporter protein CcmB [Candidatus Binataceae bacterium]